MAKKKTSYMSEKRFSLNDLIIGGCLLFGVFFFAVCLYAINFYTSKADGKPIINFSNGGNGIAEEDILTLYEDKLLETASFLQYGDELYYSVVDINKDGIKDFILKSVNEEVGTEYKFYTIDEDAFDSADEFVVYSGSLGGLDGKLYSKSGDNFVIFNGDISYYVYLDNKLISTFQVVLNDVLTVEDEIQFHDYQDLRYFN